MEDEPKDAGKAGDAAVKRRFAEAVLKMDSARDVSKAPKRGPALPGLSST